MPTENLLTLLNIPAKTLTAEQWLTIANASALPTDARPLVERAIAFYHIGIKAQAKSPADTRDTIAASVKQATQFCESLKQLVTDPLVEIALVAAVIPKSERSRSIGEHFFRGQIESVMGQIDRLRDWLVMAEKAVKPGRSGAHRRAVILAMFIWSLDEILFQFNGQHIQRSSKSGITSADYVIAVCNAGSIEVSRSSVDEALKRIIRQRNIRGGISRKSRR